MQISFLIMSNSRFALLVVRLLGGKLVPFVYIPHNWSCHSRSEWPAPLIPESLSGAGTIVTDWTWPDLPVTSCSAPTPRLPSPRLQTWDCLTRSSGWRKVNVQTLVQVSWIWSVSCFRWGPLCPAFGHIAILCSKPCKTPLPRLHQHQQAYCACSVWKFPRVRAKCFSSYQPFHPSVHPSAWKNVEKIIILWLVLGNWPVGHGY